MTTVATRRLIDARRSEIARHRREERTNAEPLPPATEEGDDTLFLLFCCCHPELSPASQVALTLRAVGGLTTREIADAFYVPEATMAQRISRAKRTLRGRRIDQPGDLAVVLRVLYLIYTAGHAGRVDLAGNAIRLARQLTLATEEPEARGLLALMLLNHARLPARVDGKGRIVTLDRQDRGLWDEREIAEGCASCSRRWPFSVPAATRSRPRSPPCTTTRRAPRRPTGRRSSLGTTTSSPSPTTLCARPRCRARAGGRGRPRPRRRRRIARDRPAARRDRGPAPLARRPGHLHELDGDLPAAAAAYAEAAQPSHERRRA